MIKTGESKMLKAFTSMTFTMTLMLLLCSCEIFGWDSSGGIEGDQPPETGETISSPFDLYYIDIPMAYPNTGSVTPVNSAGGPQIQIPNLEEQPRSVVISEENALILTQAACDQTATSILNLNVQENETTVFWQNGSMSMGSLSITKDASGDPPLQLITCID